MTEFSRMSPVAQVRYLTNQNKKMGEALTQAAVQNFKLRQEVTGGLQIVWALANQQPDKRLVIPAVDLVAAIGSLQRSRDEETDMYTFEALQPTEEQHQKLGEDIAGTGATAEEQAIITDAIEAPRASFDANGQVVNES